MKRSGVVCLLFALLMGALLTPADAARRRPRKVTREAAASYELPWLGTPSSVGGCAGFGGLGNPCPTFPISNSERWVTMEVNDASGTPTAFKIFQDTETVNLSGSSVAGPFCGSSGRRPVELTPGAEVIVRVYAAGDVVCPGAIGSSGTVTAVFSNVP